jgi:hypothetical protein
MVEQPPSSGTNGLQQTIHSQHSEHISHVISQLVTFDDDEMHPELESTQSTSQLKPASQ